MSGTNLVPGDIAERFEVHEWRNAIPILSVACAEEWRDIVDVLRSFRLLRSDILKRGGRKSVIAEQLDRRFYARGWIEKSFDTAITVDEKLYKTPTHRVDCFKNRVALEVEWNNKDPFYDRDLNNFRLLFELRAIDVGVIVTRSSALQTVFRSLGQKVQNKYPASTTHMDKLLPRIEGGGGGGCPIAVFGIGGSTYVDDE